MTKRCDLRGEKEGQSKESDSQEEIEHVDEGNGDYVNGSAGLL